MDQVCVSVLCSCYNHERYIRKCLDSILQQKTNFLYEILIHDDASTDNSQEIIKEYEKKYPDLVFPIYQSENQYSKGAKPGIINLKRARGKYIALCEGDDFWVSDQKLQKQIDFLENHMDYSLCVHAAYYAHEDSSLYKTKFFRPYGISCDIPIQKIFEGWNFATNTIVYRRSARQDLIIPFQGKCPNGDYAMSVYLALKGKVYYIDELMSAYRIESIGSLNWMWKNNVEKHIAAKKEFINMLFRIDEYTEKKYHTILENNIKDAEFEINVTSGNVNAARQDKDRYKKLGIKQKGELFIHFYFPKLFTLYRKLVVQIKKYLGRVK